MLFRNALRGAITLMANLKLFESVLEELTERVTMRDEDNE
jgi:hypothetical protein